MKAIYLLPFILLLGACAQKTDRSLPPVELVSRIIADKSLPEHSLVKNFEESDPSGSIFIIGAPRECEHLRSRLLGSDSFDNVDGRRVSDGLPDFAGEIICTIVDFAHIPYQRYIAEGRTEEYRAVNVRNLLAAMDTLSYINEFDRSGLAVKPLPKIVVMASPFAGEYSKYDIDSLFSALGCGLPVVYPVKSAAEKINGGREGDAVIGVIASPENLHSGAFSSFVSFPADTSAADPLLTFLDSCMASGNTRPLDAIILEEPLVDASRVRQTLWRITDSANPESLSYGKLIAPGCKVVDLAESVSEECYRLLRKGNLFTHRIAYPSSMEFKTVATGDSTFVLTQHDNGDPLR